MRRGVLLLALALASSCASASTWSDLWSTREQQAQSLLAQHPADAAKLFSDPRRRAYAELAAGHYPQAAELLKPFSDPNSQYNRGNALARAGQLKEALGAYDAALKQAPQDADIRHNRDLVARALQDQKPPPQQQQQGGGQKDPQNGQDKKDQQGNNNPSHDSQANNQANSQGSNQAGKKQDSGQQGGGSQAQNPQDAERQAGQGSRQAQQGRSSSGPSGGQQQAQSAQQDRGSSSSAHGRQAAAGQNTPNNTQGSGQNALQAGAANSSASSSPGPEAQQDAREAQADAAAGAQYLREHQNDRKDAHAPTVEADARPAARGDAPKKPPSEASLALDQWMQRIPEDSGELLRRKFRIEYNMRHPEQDNER